MANRKELKKDINFLTEEIIETCLLHYYFKKDDPTRIEQIDNIIDEAISLRNQLIHQLNNPAQDLNGKSLRSYYQDLLAKMMEGADTAFDKLGRLDA